MLRNLICTILLLHIVFVIVELIVFSLKTKKYVSQNKIISVPKGTHYMCSILAIVITSALCLNVIDYDASILWFYIIFGSATVVSALLVMWAVFWKLEYNDKELICRNIFGLCRKYDINDVYLKFKNQYTFVMLKDKKITDYNFMLLDIFDIKDFETFINAKINRHRHK